MHASRQVIVRTFFCFGPFPLTSYMYIKPAGSDVPCACGYGYCTMFPFHILQ